jgi:GH24 family phage-related lysozyme (muramidase)
MSVKSKLLIFTTFLSSWVGGSAQKQEDKSNDSISVKLEKVTDKNIHQPEDSCYNTNDVAKNVYNLADSVKIEADTTKIAVDTTKIDSLRERILTPEQKDSIADAKALENFNNARYDMLCVIAHCEGVKARAYWDPKGKCFTIGIGNTICPDGRKVRANDVIKNEEELMEYFNTHLDKYIFNDMKTYLPLDSMAKEEIVAIGSLIYNCGSGILRTKDGKPSRFANDVRSYIETKGDTAKSVINETAKKDIIKYFNKKVQSRGQTLLPLVKRRNLEIRIFFGEIVLSNSDEIKLENSVDFSKIALGGVYGINGIRGKDSTDISTCLRETLGQNLTDTISSQFKKLPVKSYKRVHKPNMNNLAR